MFANVDCAGVCHDSEMSINSYKCDGQISTDFWTPSVKSHLLLLLNMKPKPSCSFIVYNIFHLIDLKLYDVEGQIRLTNPKNPARAMASL